MALPPHPCDALNTAREKCQTNQHIKPITTHSESDSAIRRRIQTPICEYHTGPRPMTTASGRPETGLTHRPSSSSARGCQAGRASTNGGSGDVSHGAGQTELSQCGVTDYDGQSRRFVDDGETGPTEVSANPSSATRRQNACNVLICGSRKPKVGTTRHRAGERGRGAQTQIRGGGWAGKFSLSC